MNQSFEQILRYGKDKNASDIFIVVMQPVSFRTENGIISMDANKLTPDHTGALIREIYELANNRDINILLKRGDDDFSLSIRGVARVRVSAYKQRGSLSAVMRIINFDLPTPDKFHIPHEVVELGTQYKSGMVLVTGPAGSGKSSTLACIIDNINQNKDIHKHIITLEDPIEYLHSHKNSIVTQREVLVDTESYVTALRAALRQSPDVILLGEMRDFETISVAMTAAETGHLLLSTLHTKSAASTINRIIDAFPANQQHQIAVQLSTVLNAVVCQQLVETTNPSEPIKPVFEIMTVNPAIRNMIRENKIYQIDGMVYSASKNKKSGMRSMDDDLNTMYKNGEITEETAKSYAFDANRIGRD